MDRGELERGSTSVFADALLVNCKTEASEEDILDWQVPLRPTFGV